jgi:hypothetical protein
VDPYLRDILRPKAGEEASLRDCLEAALEDYRREFPEERRTDLRSPTIVGLLTSHLLLRDDISGETKLRACMELFHSIPLPEREDEAFLTERTVPRGLQEAAQFLLRKGEFVEYHLLHLIYALYLDPRLSSAAPLDVLEGNLRMIMEGDFEENLKMLYAYLLLSSPILGPETTAPLMSALLEAEGISTDAKRSLCMAALDRTFSLDWFTRLATAEGLFPRGVDRSDVLLEVRVRPLPGDLATVAGEWLLHGSGKP